MSVPGAQKGRKKAADLLELELQTAVLRQANTGNQTRLFCNKYYEELRTILESFPVFHTPVMPHICTRNKYVNKQKKTSAMKQTGRRGEETDADMCGLGVSFVVYECTLAP